MDNSPGRLPSLHSLLETTEAAGLIGRFGRPEVVGALRQTLDACRADRKFGQPAGDLLDAAAETLARRAVPSQRPVFNLTGTVLHTNLGRAPLPPEAAQAAAAALRGATNLEYDLAAGRRGERDDHISELLRDR